MSEAVNIGDVLAELNVKMPVTAVAQVAAEQVPAEDAVAEVAGDVPGAEAAVEDDAATVEDEQLDEGDEAGDSEEESDEDAAGEEKEARAVRKLNKRVDKLTARAKSAEEAGETLRSQLAEAQAKLERAQPIILQDSQDILGEVTTVEDLDARVQSANIVIDEVPDLLSTADADGEVEVRMGDGSVKTFSRAQLQDRLRLAKAIVKGESKRREFLSMREPAIAEAKREYPELFQEDHAARKLMLETLKRYPGLAKMHNVEVAIGDMINGYVMRLDRAKKVAAKPASDAKPKPAAEKPKIAPAVIKPSAQPKSAKPKGDGLDALRSDGSRNAAEKFVANLFG